MFSPATVRAPAERSRRRAICSDAGLEAPRRNRLRRRARNDPRCGFVDDGLSATGPLAVEKSDDFPTAQPFAHKLHSAPIICIEIILKDTRRMRVLGDTTPPCAAGGARKSMAASFERRPMIFAGQMHWRDGIDIPSRCGRGSSPGWGMAAVRSSVPGSSRANRLRRPAPGSPRRIARACGRPRR